MPTISTLTVDVTARTSRFRAGMRTVGLGLAAVGAAAFAAFREFEKSEQVTAQTVAVLKSTGGAANVTAKGIDRLTSSLMKKTAIDDETIRNGANLLLTFTKIRNETGKGNRIFDRATSSIVDMSVALDQDLKSSAIQVGKALNDPVKGITALQRVGVSFTQQQKDMVARWVEQGDVLKAQRFILDELTTEFGGSAEAQVTGSKRMATALGELAETAGRLLAPAFTVLIDGAMALASFLQSNLGPALASIRAWLTRLWNRIGPVVTAFGRELVEAATQVWGILVNKLWPALKRIWEAISPVVEIVGRLAGVIIAVALEAIPVIVEGIALWIEHIGRVITWIRRVISWVREKLMAAWNAIKGPVLAVIGAITTAVLTLVEALQDAWEWLQRLAGGGGQGGNPPVHITEGPGGVINVEGSGLPGIPPFQHGGRMRAGMAGLVGEAGPEIWVPDTDGTIIPNGGGGPQTIIVQLADEELARVIVRGLNAAGRRA